MTQTRTAALDALERTISNAVGAGRFFRNPEAPVAASHDGVVIMSDGDPGTPEMILSPLSFAFEHQVAFEIAASGENRRAALEALIALFEPALANDRTLGGKVDDARITLPPDISDYPVDGAETECSASLSVQLSYTAASAAG